MAILYPERLDNIESVRLVETVSCVVVIGHTHTRYAKDKEAEAVAELSKLLTEKGVGRVEACGLFVDSDKSFLAASPDGVVGEDAVVEVKCPLSCADTSLQWLAAHDPSFCLQRDPASGE